MIAFRSFAVEQSSFCPY